jgi:hypothetical protein
MALIAQALVTADEVENYLQIQTATYDTVIEYLINGVSQRFCTETSRSLISTVYTALALDGNGRDVFYLPNWPVTVAPTVKLNTTSLTITTHYLQDLPSGKLMRVGGVWTKGTQNLVVTYTAGYTVALLPTDLKLAALTQIAAQYQRFIAKDHGVTSASVQGSSVSHVEGGLLPEVKEILELYRSWRA